MGKKMRDRELGDSVTTLINRSLYDDFVYIKSGNTLSVS